VKDATGAFTFVRMTRPASGSVNGVRLGRLRAGESYLVPAPVAWHLVTIGAARECDRSHKHRRLALVVEPSGSGDPSQPVVDRPGLPASIRRRHEHKGPPECGTVAIATERDK